MCYVSISTVTDYDVWAEKSVTAKEVIETLSKNVEKIKKMLIKLIEKMGGKITGFAFIIELTELNGIKEISKYNCKSLVKY